jgi:hypothetical protein
VLELIWPLKITLLTLLDSATRSELKPHMTTITVEHGEMLHGSSSEIQFAYFPQSTIVSVLARTEQGWASDFRSTLTSRQEMGKLDVYEKQMLTSPDQQISLTDPDSRSMATSGRGSGVVGYNVQVAVDTEHHLIVAHEVTNSGSDRAQLANMATQAKAVLKTETLEAVADRGYFRSPEILACHEAGITVTLPKPQTSGAKSDGRLGKQDFAYLPEEDAYRCPAGERLPYRFTSEEDGKMLRRYWTTASQNCRSPPLITVRLQVRARWPASEIRGLIERELG